MSVRAALGATRGQGGAATADRERAAGGDGRNGRACGCLRRARMLLMLAFPGARDVPIEASPSLIVVGFAFALSLVTGILFGVAPAWMAAQAKPVEALRSGTRTTAAGASLLQRRLVVLQAALSLVLLVGAGLFSQSLGKLENSDLKLDATNRYIMHINPQAAGYRPAQVEALYRTMEERFHVLSGGGEGGHRHVYADGGQQLGHRRAGPGTAGRRAGRIVCGGNAEYFDSVGTHVLMGRGFTVQDTSAAPAVVVVNQAFVKAFFKDGSSPIGRRMGPPGPKSSGDFEIVGVVEDTVYTAVQWKNHSMYFIPMTQRFRAAIGTPSTKTHRSTLEP